jgi:uncharacterized protein
VKFVGCFVRSFALLVAAMVCPLRAGEIDAGGIRAEIARIRAIDNHCHADAVSSERIARWNSATPLGVAPYPPVVRLRLDNPEWLRAWSALFDYTHQDFTLSHLQVLLETKRRSMRDRGEGYPAWVLDRAGVEIALVNADGLGAGLAGPRFRWVPMADPLLYPFEKRRDRLERLMREVKVQAVPGSLTDYLQKVVTPTLERWQKAGVPAMKFLAAYRRPIDFAAVAEAQAEEIYARYARGEEASGPDYRALQDFLFRTAAREAGRLSLVVHVHTGNGNGPYFNNTGANPALLESVLDDRGLRQTQFVLVHGGWPFENVTTALLDKPSVYADFSAQTFYLSPRVLSEVLRRWLAWQPEKVLFGSDAYSDPNTPLTDWEEKMWLGTATAREALALALDGMMRDNEITRERALEIARLVLRDNARRLYRLP